MRTVAALLRRKTFIFPLGLWLLAILFSPVVTQLLNWLVMRAFPPTIYDLTTTYPWRIRWTLALVGGLSVAVAWLLDWRFSLALGLFADFEKAGTQTYAHPTRFVSSVAQVVGAVGRATPLLIRLLLAIELAFDISFVANMASYEHALFEASLDIMIGLNPMILVEPLFLAVNCVFALCILFNAYPWTWALAIRITRAHALHGSSLKHNRVSASAYIIGSLVRASVFAVVFWLFDSSAVTPRPALNPQLVFTLALGAAALASMVPHLPSHLGASREPY